MEKRTQNIGKLAVGLIGLISGCQTGQRDVKVGNYRVSNEAYDYLIDVEKGTNDEELKHFAGEYAGEDHYLSAEEARNGIKDLTIRSLHY